jgi:hypothetical protein
MNYEREYDERSDARIATARIVGSNLSSFILPIPAFAGDDFLFLRVVPTGWARDLYYS